MGWATRAAILVLSALLPLGCMRMGYRPLPADSRPMESRTSDASRDSARDQPADPRRDQPADLRADDAPLDSTPQDRSTDRVPEGPLPDLPRLDAPSPDTPRPDLTVPDLRLCAVGKSGDCGLPADGPFKCWYTGNCAGTYTGTGLRLWPDQTNATGPKLGGVSGCSHSAGYAVPSIGAGSANWFGLDCGSYKEFPVGKGCLLRIISYADCNCPTCLLTNARYEIQEKTGASWSTKLVIDHPYILSKCDGYTDTYSPTTDRIRVVAVKPAYLCLFQE